MVTILATCVAAEGNEEKLAEGLRDYVPILEEQSVDPLYVGGCQGTVLAARQRQGLAPLAGVRPAHFGSRGGSIHPSAGRSCEMTRKLGNPVPPAYACVVCKATGIRVEPTSGGGTKYGA